MQVAPAKGEQRPFRLLAWMVAAGAAAGIAYSALSPARWPASVAIQLPQIGTGVALMDPDTVLQRIKIPDFADDVLRAAALPSGSDSEAKLFKRTLRADKPKDSDIIRVRVQGHSAADAKKLAETVVSVLQKEHAADLAKARELREKNLANLNAEIAEEEAQHAQIIAAARSLSAEKLSILLSVNDREIQPLKKQRDELRDQLPPLRTFNTKAIAPVSVAQHPLHESMPICAFIGAVGAIMIWGALAMFRKDDEAANDPGLLHHP